MSQVVVAEPSIHRTDERTVVSVDVTVPGSPTQTVEYVLPPVAVHRQQVIDAMFVVGRLVAMKEGWRLVLPGPVSRRLLDRAEIMQDIMLEWYPWYTKPIPLDFEVAEPLDLPPERGAISTFTGGVDSFHTVLENRERLTELLFIHGMDIRLEETDFRMRVSKELSAAAADIGLPLLQVETNVRELTDPYASWGKKAHGSILSSVAILLAERADTFLIPGSRLRSTVRGVGWGSHVLIDRLNSTDYLSVVHDSADVTRHSKTARVAQSETALRYLRVCYSSTEEYNCGTCPKCRRTQLDLDLVGVTDTERIFAESVPIPEVLAEFEIPDAGGAELRPADRPGRAQPGPRRCRPRAEAGDPPLRGGRGHQARAQAAVHAAQTSGVPRGVPPEAAQGEEAEAAPPRRASTTSATTPRRCGRSSPIGCRSPSPRRCVGSYAEPGRRRRRRVG